MEYDKDLDVVVFRMSGLLSEQDADVWFKEFERKERIHFRCHKTFGTQGNSIKNIYKV